jgi:hypothetical protein
MLDETGVVLADVEQKLHAIMPVPQDGLLAILGTVTAAKEVRDQAEALRVYAARAGKGLLVQNRCAYVKITAERRAGELLSSIQREQGRRMVRTEDGPRKRVGWAKSGRQGDEPAQETWYQRELKSASLAPATAYRWQVMARVPDGVVHQLWLKADDQSRELTSAAVFLEGQGRRVREQADVHRRLVTRLQHWPPSVPIHALSVEELEELLAECCAAADRMESVIAEVRAALDRLAHDLQHPGHGGAEESDAN